MMITSYHHDVRTTLTIDDDVWLKIERQRRKSGKSLKDTVNHYLRIGLNAKEANRRIQPFVVRARPLGLPPGLSYDNVEELLDQIEGAEHA